MTSSATLTRTQRGSAARLLLELARADQLASVDTWSWDVLGAVPAWAFAEEIPLRRLQALCGLLYIAPELHLWIDRRALEMGIALVGEEAFQAARQLAQSRFEQSTGAAVSAPSVADIDSLQSRILNAGAAVLLGSLDESLPVDALESRFGNLSWRVSRDIAEPVVALAQTLQAECSA